MYTSQFNNGQFRITLDTVLERDMDLLIIEEFIANKDFAGLFLDATKIDRNSEIVSIQRSLRYQMGESDIVVVLKTPQGKNVGLHIEDKVNAEAQQEQYDRYEERASLLAKTLDYSEYKVCITAPEYYLRTNEEARKYPAAIPYERLRDYFDQRDDLRSKYKLALLHCALGKKDITIAVPNEAVTSFWNEFERIAMLKGLQMKASSDQHGKESKFIRFKTLLSKVYVIYKARHGHVDLQFPNMAGKLVIPREMLSNDMVICDAGKSASVRIGNPKWVLNLEDSLENNKEIVDEILNSVERLVELANIVATKSPDDIK